MRLSKRGKRFLSCSRYPECKGAQNVDREGKPVVLEVTEHKCPTCAKPMIKRIGRFGPFLGCSGYPECKVIQNIDKKTGEPLPVRPPPVDTGLLCPKCGKKNALNVDTLFDQRVTWCRYKGCDYEQRDPR